MLCVNCGKAIPFTDDICPYCQRDKSSSQSYSMLAVILGFVFGWLGLAVFGFWGAVIGFFIGCFVAMGVSGGFGDSSPPEVNVTNQTLANTVPNDIESRLDTLQRIKDNGTITQDEYEKRRRDILAEI